MVIIIRKIGNCLIVFIALIQYIQPLLSSCDCATQLIIFLYFIFVYFQHIYAVVVTCQLIGIELCVKWIYIPFLVFFIPVSLMVIYANLFGLIAAPFEQLWADNWHWIYIWSCWKGTWTWSWSWHSQAW